jgi:drug/metabolite transporter (DMT)-like permease
MTVSGISWGIYTLKGRSCENPLMDTTYNFIRTIPFVALLTVFTVQNINMSTEGIILAFVSGAITSGLGYTIWYIALRGLSSTQAAVIQLSVPVIAAIGGVLFVSETITMRLIISAVVVLTGILMVVLGKYHFTKKVQSSEVSTGE